MNNIPRAALLVTCCAFGSHFAVADAPPTEPLEREVVWGISAEEQEAVRHFVRPGVHLGISVPESVEAKLFTGLLLPRRGFIQALPEVAKKVFGYLAYGRVDVCAVAVGPECGRLRELMSRSVLARAMFIKFYIGRSANHIRAVQLVTNLEEGPGWVPHTITPAAIVSAARSAPLREIYAKLESFGANIRFSVSRTLLALAAKHVVAPAAEHVVRPPLPRSGAPLHDKRGIAFK